MDIKLTPMAILIGTAIAAFFVTAIDDFLVLALFVAKVKSGRTSMQERHIITGKSYKCFNFLLIDSWYLSQGQILGFSLICLISCSGTVFGIVLPLKYIALLGFLPVFIGIQGLWELFEECSMSGSTAAEGENKVLLPSNTEEGYVKETSQTPTGDDSMSPVIVDSLDENLEEAEQSTLGQLCTLTCRNLLEKETLEVTIVVIGNGTDNIAVFLPIFATASPMEILCFIIVFYGMLALWIILAFQLVRMVWISALLKKYGQLIVPPLLILLGLWILTDSILAPSWMSW